MICVMDPSDAVDRMVVALQDTTRREILLSFYADPGPRTVSEVTAASRVHRSVVYAHLEKLLGLGYLVSGRARGRPGKPAKTYRLAPNPPGAAPPGRNLFILASVLSRAVQATGAAGLAEVRASAYSAGRHLSDGRVPPGRALDPLRHLSEEFTTALDNQLVVTQCIFREVCAAEQAVISAAHAGLIEGALRSAAIEAPVAPLGCGAYCCSFRVEWPGWRELAPADRP